MFHVDGREKVTFEVVGRSADLDRVTIYSGKIDGSITISNRGSYSARNPALVLQFSGMGILHDSYPGNAGWEIVECNEVGISILQWNADPASSIHGYSYRRLSLSLGTVAWRRVTGESQAAAQQRMMKESALSYLHPSRRRVQAVNNGAGGFLCCRRTRNAVPMAWARNAGTALAARQHASGLGTTVLVTRARSADAGTADKYSNLCGQH